jgi:hypothetical protein
MTLKSLLSGVVILATLGTALPAMAQLDYKWVLLGLHVGMGSRLSYSVYGIPKFPTEPTPAAGDGSLPTFPTKTDCDLALKRVIAAYSGKSHAAGNYGRYLCANFETWTLGQ